MKEYNIKQLVSIELIHSEILNNFVYVDQDEISRNLLTRKKKIINKRGIYKLSRINKDWDSYLGLDIADDITMYVGIDKLIHSYPKVKIVFTNDDFTIQYFKNTGSAVTFIHDFTKKYKLTMI